MNFGGYAKWIPALLVMLPLAEFQPAAHAASVSIDQDGTLTYVAAAGEMNDLEIDYAPPPSWFSDPDRLRIVDAGAELLPGPGCSAAGDAVECPLPTAFSVDLADESDRARLLLWPGPADDVPASMRGGTGDDYLLFDADEGDGELSGGDGNDELRMAQEGNGIGTGGAGDDVIVGINPTGDDKKEYLGGRGNDTLDAYGDGTDVLDGGVGADVILGMPDAHGGKAILSYAGRRRSVSVTVDGIANDGVKGEGDNVKGAGSNRRFTDVVTGSGDDFVEQPTLWTVDLGRGRDTLSYASMDEAVTAAMPPTVENLIGSRFGDTLVGDPGRNTIDGRSGDDRLEGRGGRDILVGGEGSDALDGGEGGDQLLMRDGSADDGVCGGGVDVFEADSLDTIAADCERQRRPAGT